MIRWLTAMLDTPAHAAPAAEAFWQGVTACRPSPRRDEGRFVTFLPRVGDAHIRAQIVNSGAASVHLDVHVDDVDRQVRLSLEAGATIVRRETGIGVLRSPGGLLFCVVGWHGDCVVAEPVDGTRLDQVCVDIPAGSADTETGFWSRVLDAEDRITFSAESEFALWRRAGLPLRLLFQRLDEPTGAVRSHLDLAAGAQPQLVDAAARHHQKRGATSGRHLRGWQVMVDPAGRRYCLTTRDPVTGDGA